MQVVLTCRKWEKKLPLLWLRWTSSLSSGSIKRYWGTHLFPAANIENKWWTIVSVAKMDVFIVQWEHQQILGDPSDPSCKHRNKRQDEPQQQTAEGLNADCLLFQNQFTSAANFWRSECRLPALSKPIYFCSKLLKVWMQIACSFKTSLLLQQIT